MTRVSYQEKLYIKSIFTIDNVVTFYSNKKCLRLVKKHGSIADHITNAQVCWS